MFVTKRRWNRLCKRVDKLEKELIVQRKQVDEKIYDVTKKILRQPEELSEEIDSIESTKKLIQDIINDL